MNRLQHQPKISVLSALNKGVNGQSSASNELEEKPSPAH